VAALLVHTGLIGKFGTDYIARHGMQVGRNGYVAVSVDGHDVSSAVLPSLASMEDYESDETALDYLSRLTLFQRANGISLSLFGFSTIMRSPVTIITLASNP
jgi:hypothetical protein